MMVEKKAKIIPINQNIKIRNTELLLSCYNLCSEILDLIIEKEGTIEIEKDKVLRPSIEKNP
jgi:hypothetical protein